ncbi:hypothetical protein KRX57_08540 [Weeksellaceae bacterium TAE3-ERU29]|nr:hypothetical protein [Weeksellaceae bacterium TAE3-ERU29]
MKKIILNMAFIIFSGCSNNYGYIYDIHSKKPISNVIVRDLYDPQKQVLTDESFLFLNV